MGKLQKEWEEEKMKVNNATGGAMVAFDDATEYPLSLRI